MNGSARITGTEARPSGAATPGLAATVVSARHIQRTAGSPARWCPWLGLLCLGGAGIATLVACSSGKDGERPGAAATNHEQVEARSAGSGEVDRGNRGGGSVPGDLGSRVFVVERETESLAVYDLHRRELLPNRITGFGNMRHAIMTFSPDLRYGYVATRNGKLSRIDLQTLERDADVFTSDNSIDIAISQDGRYIATAEYAPGGVTILDARTMEVVKKHPSERSRATGVVDAPGNRFVAVLIEGREIWIINGNDPELPIEHRIPVTGSEPYDAMITPDGRYYVVGHMDSDTISVLDVRHPDRGVREVSIVDPHQRFERATPVKLPHMASWAVAGDHIFVPLVGEARLAVLDRHDFSFVRSIALRGHPVYAVRSPAEHEVWVSFSGEENDAYVQVIDTETLEVTQTIEVGGRIYHMDFTPRGSHVLVTANRDNKLVLVNAGNYQIEDEETINSPSGVFGIWRAFRIGL